MTTTVPMTAPVAGGQYIAKSGTTYTADVNRIIQAVVGDIQSLTNMGCIVVDVRPVASPVASSYLVQGAINMVSSSTAVRAFTLAAPASVGIKTTLVEQSTSADTFTSSACDILTQLGVVSSVLTGGAKGSVDLEAINSSQWQITNRSVVLSSLVVAAITSS